MKKSLIKTKELELKRNIIIDEAKKLIGKHGFKNTKMEEIAKKVGFSKSSLYSYFKDKEAIALHIINQYAENFHNRISDLPNKDLPAIEKLEIMKKGHIEFIKNAKNFMIIKTNLSVMDKCHKDVIEFKTKLFNVLNSIIEQGIAEEVFNKSLDAYKTTMLLESMLTGVVFINSILEQSDYKMAPNFKVDEMTTFALDFFYMGITNTTMELNK